MIYFLQYGKVYNSFQVSNHIQSQGYIMPTKFVINWTARITQAIDFLYHVSKKLQRSFELITKHSKKKFSYIPTHHKTTLYKPRHGNKLQANNYFVTQKQSIRDPSDLKTLYIHCPAHALNHLVARIGSKAVRVNNQNET